MKMHTSFPVSGGSQQQGLSLWTLMLPLECASEARNEGSVLGTQFTGKAVNDLSRSLGWEDPLESEMAALSSILA